MEWAERIEAAVIVASLVWARMELKKLRAEIKVAMRDIDGIAEVIGTERAKARLQTKEQNK